MTDNRFDFESVSGFSLTEQGETDFPKGKTARFRHKASGIDIFLLENDDDNLGMSIAFRVPQADNSDTAHVLEHAVTASSKRYPSRDIFFDMEGRTYSTFLNAETFPAVTIYQLASRSQEQIMKMADVYLSCLTEPSVLTEEKYFLREGVRRELRHEEDPITLSGVVFNEDLEYMTDTERVTFGAVMENLYPDCPASRNVGCCWKEWQNLTWQKAKRVFRTYYRPDNSLIVLYGNWDWRRMLAYLDTFFRGKVPEETGPYIEPVPAFPEMHKEIRVEVPAFCGDDTERASSIVWAADLSCFDDVEKQEIAVLCDILNEDGSVFGRIGASRGFESTADWETDIADGYPVDLVSVWLYDTEAEKKEDFVRTIRETLMETEKAGIDPELLKIVLKGMDLDRKLAENHASNGVDVAENVCCFWASSGKTDFFRIRREAIRRIRESGGEIFKQLAGRLLRAGRTVTAVGTPKPGLAEKINGERAEKLRKEKEKMTPEEIRALIRKTEEFDRWNADEVHGGGFTIPAKLLPEPLPVKETGRADRGETAILTSDGEIPGTVAASLCLDISGVTREELYPLNLAVTVMGEIAAGQYSRETLSNRISEYLDNFYMDLRYPGRRSGEFSWPMLCLSWVGASEDFETSLRLALEILQHTRWDDLPELIYAIGKYREDYNHAKSDPLAEARGLADAELTGEAGFAYETDGPGFYRYLCHATEKTGILAEEIPAILGRVLGAKRRFMTITAGKEELFGLRETAFRVLAECLVGEPPERRFPEREKFLLPRRGITGIRMDSPLTSVAFRANLSAVPGMRGRYLPLFMAAANRYLIPELRFRNGAYSGGFSFNIAKDLFSLFSSSDPAAGQTVSAMRRLPDALRAMRITQEELEGYILETYGMATPPAGPVTRAVTASWRRVTGIDSDKTEQIVRDIRNADISDREAAADCLAKYLSRGVFVIAGNEERLRQEERIFDEILDYRKEQDPAERGRRENL